MIQRANTTSQWLGSDTVCNYKLDNNLYRSDSFDYKFNDYGFRCDNFNQESDIPIVFLGCSFTEGIGLPAETVWTYQIITRIRNKTSKNIPYWNLATGGAGVDTIARHLYWFNEMHKIKFIFALLPNLCRREYCIDDTVEISWGLNFGGHHDVDNLFRNEHFKFLQTNRSFMIIDSILKQNNTQMCCSQWNFGEDNYEKLFLQNNFPNFNFFHQAIISKDRARDGKHGGPIYHRELTDLFWDKINHLF